MRIHARNPLRTLCLDLRLVQTVTANQGALLQVRFKGCSSAHEAAEAYPGDVAPLLVSCAVFLRATDCSAKGARVASRGGRVVHARPVASQAGLGGEAARTWGCLRKGTSGRGAKKAALDVNARRRRFARVAAQMQFQVAEPFEGAARAARGVRTACHGAKGQRPSSR